MTLANPRSTTQGQAIDSRWSERARTTRSAIRAGRSRLRILAGLVLLLVSLGGASVSSASQSSENQAGQTPPPRQVGSLSVDQHTSAPLQVIHSAYLEARPAKVYRLIGDNEGWPEWFPAIQSLELDNRGARRAGREGATRHVTLSDGAVLAERIVAYQEPSIFAYAIQPQNPLGLGGHLGVFELQREGRGTLLVWHQFFDHAQAQQVGTQVSGLMGSVLAGLVQRFGGELRGAVYGAEELVFDLRRKVPASAEQVWEVVGEGFGEVHQWASVVSQARLQRPADGGWVGAQRSCSTVVGSIKETVLSYDEEGRSISYQAEGLPPAVSRAVNRWQVVGQGGGKSEVLMRLEVSMAPGLPAAVAGMMKGQMLGLLEVTLQDLAYYLATGRAMQREPA